MLALPNLEHTTELFIVSCQLLLRVHSGAPDTGQNITTIMPRVNYYKSLIRLRSYYTFDFPFGLRLLVCQSKSP